MASAAVSIVSFASAVDPSNVIFPLPISIAFAASSVPAIKVPEAKEVKPAIVDAVAPSATAVLPIVTSSFASWELGIALVPNSPVELLYVSPDPEAILNKPLISELEGPV